MPDPAVPLPRFLRVRLGRPVIRRADRHRDRAEWREAARDYRRALRWMPWREDLTVQIGNCLKELGDHRGAIGAYRAVRGGPDRVEALRQIADVHRRAGLVKLPFAIAESPAALTGQARPADPLPPLTGRLFPNRLRVDQPESRRWLGTLGHPPGEAARPAPDDLPAIILDQVGALSVLRDGVAEPLFAGVVAIRARILSPEPPGPVALWLGDGQDSRRVALVEVTPAPRDGAPAGLHVMNAWLASDRLPAGRHWLSIRTAGEALVTGLFVNVAEGGVAPLLDGSDAVMPSPAADAADIVAAVVAAPTRVRPATRSLFDRPIRSILVMRTDHLGDVAASLPAMARLRTLFPEARLTVLVQPPLRGIVAASGIADHVATIALAYDPRAETYILPVAEEQRLAPLLAAEAFDLAIDLCPAKQSRPLLLMTGATYLAGFHPHDFPFLDYGIDLRSRDKANQLETMSHAAYVLTLVEGLAVAVGGGGRVVRRIDAPDAALARHGLTAGGYVLLHSGSRYAINRWPMAHFHALAGRVVGETGLSVVFFSDDPAHALPAALVAGGRVHLLGRLEPDMFDAIVAAARVFVGNDSGPKHLAAVRGVPTVSIHVDRLNWNEWGQDGHGTILSKRVPCTGCGLNDIDLCGREAVCVRSIGVDEVMDAVRRYIGPSTGAATGTAATAGPAGTGGSNGGSPA